MNQEAVYQTLLRTTQDAYAGNAEMTGFPLQTRPCAAPSQCQYRPVVWPVDAPGRAFTLLSSRLIHCVIPSHPIHLFFHVIYLVPGAAMTHTGYEDLLIKDKRKLALGTFYHQLHHRYYECNYGNQEMPWDRWFGTFHDGSDEGTKETRSRKKDMYSGV